MNRRSFLKTSSLSLLGAAIGAGESGSLSNQPVEFQLHESFVPTGRYLESVKIQKLDPDDFGAGVGVNIIRMPTKHIASAGREVSNVLNNAARHHMLEISNEGSLRGRIISGQLISKRYGSHAIDPLPLRTKSIHDTKLIEPETPSGKINPDWLAAENEYVFGINGFPLLLEFRVEIGPMKNFYGDEPMKMIRVYRRWSRMDGEVTSLLAHRDQSTDLTYGPVTSPA